MNKYLRQRIFNRSGSCLLWCVLVLSVSLEACDKPPRKKMPDLTDLSLAFEGQGGVPNMLAEEWPVYSNDTIILKDGRSSHFLAFTLPSPAYDSAVWDLVKASSVLSGPLLSQWAKMGKDGILIDLRTSLNPAADLQRADYLLEKFSSISLSVPVILLWDAGSRSRATYFSQVFGTLPEFGLRLAGTSETARQAYRQDCFQHGPLTLDNP